MFVVSEDASHAHSLVIVTQYQVVRLPVADNPFEQSGTIDRLVPTVMLLQVSQCRHHVIWVQGG
jgi:hypothetical protein